ncbi:hypothetical protein FRC03_003651 [Tulasnella sp. 419]|nr:hypothetical protein FRC03_003651 [Tulasnella sp. 419]
MPSRTRSFASVPSNDASQQGSISNRHYLVAIPRKRVQYCISNAHIDLLYGHALQLPRSIYSRKRYLPSVHSPLILQSAFLLSFIARAPSTMSALRCDAATRTSKMRDSYQ